MKAGIDRFAKRIAAERERNLRAWIEAVNDGPGWPKNVPQAKIILSFDDGMKATMTLQPVANKRAKRRMVANG